jgi:hypothetical protein
MRASVAAATTLGLTAQLVLACASESVSSGNDATGGRREIPPPSADGGDGEGGAFGAQPGSELRIPVGSDEPTYVALGAPEVVEIEGDAASSDAWDLGFLGWNIVTNGGISGSGQGWSFGPAPYYYLFFPDDPIDVPLKIADHPGGAFLRWYAYGPDHGLYSRFHVYGVRSRDRLFKLQILGYRGEVQGVAVSALYRVRYAEVTEGGSGELVDLSNIDATANGNAADPDEPSTCLALATEERLRLTPAQALESAEWDLCFRRDVISVNGGVGGPGGVEAVDLDSSSTDTEDVNEVMERTASGELERLENADHDALTAPALEYRGDEVTSGFTGRWYLEGQPRTPNLDATWMVVGADGESTYFVAFNEFVDADEDSPGTVVLRVVPVASQ